MASTVTEQQQQDAAPPAKSRSLWRNRDYMLLWGGQGVSVLGSGISGIAFPFLIVQYLHGSVAEAGFAAALRAVPYVIFSLPAGALIDRWNRKLVMIICDLGRAVALGSIPVAFAFGGLSIPQVYIVATVEGALFVFFNIAEVACLPRVVSKDQLPAASGQNQATEGVANLISQPIGGAIYGFGAFVPFVFDAISYLASVLSLGFIRTPFQAERTAERRHLLVEIREGVSWLWNQKLIRYIAFLTGALNFVFGGSFLILFWVATKHMHADAFVVGLLGAVASIGGVLGSVLGATIQKRFSFGTVIIATLWVQAIAWPFLVLAPNPYVLGAIFGLVVMMGPIYNVVQVSYRLTLIPDRLQGRVNSAVRLITFGFIPAGAAITGVLLDAVDATWTIIIFGVVMLASAIITTVIPLVRNAKPIAKLASAD